VHAYAIGNRLGTEVLTGQNDPRTSGLPLRARRSASASAQLGALHIIQHHFRGRSASGHEPSRSHHAQTASFRLLHLPNDFSSGITGSHH
jgi:hypothetical protein